MTLVEVAVKTHIGHIRQVNEDSADIIFREEDIVLAIVADGMGGHQAGDVASQLTLQQLRESFLDVETEKTLQEWQDWLLKEIQETNLYIYEYAKEKDVLHGMGTTIVASLFVPNGYVVAHVGDSRIYRFTEEQIDSLTSDHSLVNELLKSGQITKEEAEFHPQRNVITRAIGTEETVEIDVKTLSYLGDELILLCSDGLSNLVDESQLKEVLSESISLEKKADKLVSLALDAGGDDNISVVLVQTKSYDGDGK